MLLKRILTAAAFAAMAGTLASGTQPASAQTVLQLGQ